MKLTRFICVTMIFVLLNTMFVLADDKQIIRVGIEALYKNTSSISLSNDDIIIGYSENNAFYKGEELNANDEFSMDMPTAEFVKIDEEFTSYDDALDVSSVIDDSLVGFDDNGKWYVLINVNDDNVNSVLDKYDGEIIRFNGENAVLYDGDDMEVAFLSDDYNASFKNANGYTDLGSRTYRGYMELYSSSIGTFTIVNVLDMEEYLYSVVPSEMPSSWDMEALKAQAVSARTYANAQLSKHASSGYDVCDNEHCQMYLGVRNESDRTTNAVNATSGLEAYYDGALIDAVFSSSDGGVTADSADVWENSLPYLQEKKDPYDTEGLVWERLVTTSDLEGMLSAYGQNIGDVTGMAITKISPNGRVNELTIYGTNGSYALTKENIRYFFSYDGEASLPSRLFTITSNDAKSIKTQKSSSYTINSDDVYVSSNGNDTDNITLNDDVVVITDKGKTNLSSDDLMIKGSNSNISVENNGNTNNGNTSGQIEVGSSFTINGKGYGHGVGLSQYGAKGMASAGYSYDEILKFYYTGIDIY